MNFDFQRVAVLNRGECASRFMRAARTWSGLHGQPLETIALYTTPDEGAPFVRSATRAVDMGDPLVPGPDGKLRSVYLDVDGILDLCQAHGADAIWPGWGFLAESPELADACDARGLVFIGPSGDAMRLLGDKEAAKHLAEEHEVPVSDWSRGSVADAAEAKEHADRIGYPVLLKAVAGGGGRGIRVVHEAEELEGAFASATAEAASSFGNANVIVEQFVASARHIEVQVLADRHGTVWALGTRDCSLQRRHQKVIEEAPAHGLSDEVQQTLCDAARAVARASGYVGAGTVEFLVVPQTDQICFLEMNTRLQVEHTVTECVYGVDLVAWQIDVARGQKLPADEPPSPRGWALEARLNAEDPDAEFAPSVGHLARFDVPHGPGVRIDAGYGAGDTVPSEFDSNLAKIIAYGATRKEAWARLRTALAESVVAVAGGPTNRSLLLELVSGAGRGDEEPRTTRWLDDYVQARPAFAERPTLDVALAGAAIGDHLRARRGQLANFFGDARKGLPRRAPTIEPTPLRYLVDGASVSCTVATRGAGRYRIEAGQGAIHVSATSTGPRSLVIETEDGRRHSVVRVATTNAVYVEVDGVAHRFTRTSDGRVRAGMPAAVTLIHVQPGERVEAGERLVTLEVMKMETSVNAPVSGVVTAVHVDVSGRVAAGDVLVTIDAAGESKSSTPDLEPFAVAPAADADPIEVLRLGVQGYDIGDDDVDAAIAAIEVDPCPVTRGHLVDVLEIALARLHLFQTGIYDDGRGPRGDSSAEQLAWFLQHFETDDAVLSERFLDRLKAIGRSYGVSSLRRGFELESALLRVFQAHVAEERTDRILFAIVPAVVRARDDSRSHTDELRLREVLEALANAAIPRNRPLARSLWQAVYLLCDKPRHRLVVRRQLSAAHASYADLVDPEATAQRRADSRAALVDTPLGVLLELLQQVASDASHRVEALCGVLFERLHGDPAQANGARALFASTPTAAARALRDLGTGSVVDLFLGFEPEESLIRGVPEALHGPGRINLVWGNGEEGLRSRTWDFEPGAGAAVERTLYRDFHPARGAALEVDRLEDFDCERLPAPGGLFLAVATAKDGSGDQRLFAIGEVERFEPEIDAEGAVRIPEFEKTFLDAVYALRTARTTREKLVWNRMTLFVRPEVALSRQQMEAVAERLAPPTSGLGLEKVVVRANIKDRRGRVTDTIVEWSNPTGRGPMLNFALPRSRAIRVLSEYERRVVEARRRGKFYPYELIRALTVPELGFAEGDFEEMDLNAAGDSLESVYKRPFGRNTANLVVGRISNRVDRFESGLVRMLIIGDPTRTMGSLGEAECRRVIAAIDLAEAQSIPVEWVPISSGARISFDSGTENLDWTARVIRRLVEFTQQGGVVNIVVDGTCVGAQSYWNAEATMLDHCRGVLVMTGSGCMLLTGKRALEYSGSVAAPTNLGIGGLEEIMWPNGQAQYRAENLREAYAVLFDHYALTYVPPGEVIAPEAHTDDPHDRDFTRAPYNGDEGFATIGEIFSDATNPGRKRPFAIREVMDALADKGAPRLERWAGWLGGDTAVVYHAQLGGQPVCLIGIESRPVRRRGELPPDGPETWTSGTLFPQASRKVSRALCAASGVVPTVVLANLSGFDGSPESLRKWQLEYGAQIGRAVVNYDGPIVFCVVARYHGGAYVVFSQTLNEGLEAVALEGTFASVIGGGPAAAVVFPNRVRKRTLADPRVVEARAALTAAEAGQAARARAAYEAVYRTVEAEVQGQVATEFDGVHTVERARDVGSLRDIVSPATLRQHLIDRVRDGVARHTAT